MIELIKAFLEKGNLQIVEDIQKDISTKYITPKKRVKDIHIYHMIYLKDTRTDKMLYLTTIMEHKQKKIK